MEGIIKEITKLVDTLGVKDIVQLGTSLAQQGVDARGSLVEVPEMYVSDYRLKLEDATRWLEEDGLKVEAVIVQPAIEFKDCSDLEVVASNYKLKQKVKPGTRIILSYVNSEVIEASRKLFEESERQKAEDEQMKADKKAEQAMKNKQNIDKTVTAVQNGFGSAIYLNV
jgi:2',3'-cyclic-nucleotide 2'-phosphodiesterase (5'-nucleotidase family)